MRVEVDIEELVLHGFPPHQRQRIADALRAELARLLTEEGVPDGWQQGGTISQLNAGEIRVPVPAAPERTAREVARSIYGGLTR